MDKFHVSIGKNFRDNNPDAQSGTWNEFLECMTQPPRVILDISQKNGRWIMGGIFENNFRITGSKILRCMLTLDFEGCNHEEFQKLFESFNSIGWASLLYTTASHTKELPRFRVIVPLRHWITADEYDREVKCFVSLYFGKFGFKFLDKASYKPTQIMFLPTVMKGNEYIFKVNDGDYSNISIFYDPGKDFDDLSGVSVSNQKKKEKSNQGTHPGKHLVVPDLSRTFTIVDSFKKNYYPGNRNNTIFEFCTHYLDPTKEHGGYHPKIVYDKAIDLMEDDPLPDEEFETTFDSAANTIIKKINDQ